jgi:hypothetical protein
MFVVTAFIDHSYERDLAPSPLILGSTIKERQLASECFAAPSLCNFKPSSPQADFSTSRVAETQATAPVTTRSVTSIQRETPMAGKSAQR